MLSKSSEIDEKGLHFCSTAQESPVGTPHSFSKKCEFLPESLAGPALNLGSRACYGRPNDGVMNDVISFPLVRCEYADQASNRCLCLPSSISEKFVS